MVDAVDDVLHLALPGAVSTAREAPLAWRCRLRPFMSRHAPVLSMMIASLIP